MKALLSYEIGGPDTLRMGELPEPQASPGELVVRVLNCSINYPDVLIIEDKYQHKPERPFAPGYEIAGIVEEVGDGVKSWAIGDRLFGMCGNGGLAERARIEAAEAFHIPDDMPSDVASSLLMTYGTVIHALVDRAKLVAGETMLVLGAAGGVGLAAIEIGKALGATVIAAVSDQDKADAAMAAGAAKAIIYDRVPEAGQTKELANQFKAAVGPDGFDVIFDPVGGNYCDPALRSIAWEGRYLVVGFPAGIPRLPLNLTLLKSCDVRGVFWGAFAARESEANRKNVEQLISWWQDGVIRPRIGRTWPLERGADAIAWLAGRSAIGKAVVQVGDL